MLDRVRTRRYDAVECNYLLHARKNHNSANGYTGLRRRVNGRVQQLVIVQHPRRNIVKRPSSFRVRLPTYFPRVRLSQHQSKWVYGLITIL